MKRIATITENGNVYLDAEEEYSFGTLPWPLGIIGPIDRIEPVANTWLLTATNGCSVWADEIRREE